MAVHTLFARLIVVVATITIIIFGPRKYESHIAKVIVTYHVTISVMKRTLLILVN